AIRIVIDIVIAKDCELRSGCIEPPKYRHNPFVVRAGINVIADQADKVRRWCGCEFIHNTIEERASRGAVEVQLAQHDNGEPVPLRWQLWQCECQVGEINAKDTVTWQPRDRGIVTITNQLGAKIRPEIDGASRFAHDANRRLPQ